MSDKAYRVVVDGTGRRSGTVAASPTTSRQQAMAGFDIACDAFAADLAAGDMRISVLAEDEFARRTHT